MLAHQSSRVGSSEALRPARHDVQIMRNGRMCDIAAEKQKIDALLEDAARKNPMRDCADERLLTELALRALREHYEDTCPDECLRRRCTEFAERLLRRRAVERWRRASAERRLRKSA
jgi:hypothetical protein